MLGRRRAGTTRTPSTTTSPQGTWAPWMAMIGRTTTPGQLREAALSLGVRVAVHDSRQNDRDPVVWQHGQDYRAADAIQAARIQPARTRHGPERVGPER
jgi:hypothetical protein